MKAQKKLNIVLTVLLIILVSIISFVGVYRVEKNQMVNIIPSYKLGTNISGYRRVTLELIDDSEDNESESVTVEEDANESEEASNETEEASNETKEENVDEETKKENTNNYKKSAEIFKNRLKSLKVEDYSVRLDENTGKIELSIPENDQTDIILSDLTSVGKFEVTDTNTGDVLLTNSDVKKVNVEVYSQYGYTVPYMDIKFNLSGASKLKDISAEYNENAVVETNTIENTTANETTDETTDETADILNETTEDVSNEVSEDQSTDETDTSSEEESNTVAKTVDIKIDDTTMLSTGFSEIVDNGTLQLTMQSASDEEALKESLYGSYNIAAIIENDALPVEYEVTENVYVQAPIQLNNLYVIMYVLIAIAVVLSIIMIVKFKMKGLLMSIISIGYVAIHLLVIRYTNVVLSIEGIVAIGLSYIMNYGFSYILLRKIKDKNLRRDEKIENYKKCMQKYVFVLIPLVILALICCFVNWDMLYSFGMIMFWGILVSILYNLTLTNLLVRNK